ncbi:MAG: hypothetical protein Q6370_013405, partial [Candidatus Sigynarchaeota archaeon]
MAGLTSNVTTPSASVSASGPDAITRVALASRMASVAIAGLVARSDGQPALNDRPCPLPREMRRRAHCELAPRPVDDVDLEAIPGPARLAGAGDRHGLPHAACSRVEARQLLPLVGRDHRRVP